MLALALAGCQTSPSHSGSAPDVPWPSYGGTYENTRHSTLGDISRDNVGELKLAWKFNTGLHGLFETSPIVTGGRMYFTTGPDNGVYALDAATGALVWHYVPVLGPTRYVFAVNRGVAVDGGRVFYTILDDRLIALDAQSGKHLWESRIGDANQGLTEDAAPLAWDGLVFVGSAGDEFGVRGFFSAYSQKDGKLVWRWWAVGPGWEGTFQNTVRGYSLHRNVASERASLAKYRDAWKTGGGAVWMTPALSPKDSAIYLSTGNPAPALNGSKRPGDNLYTDSIVALDAHSGKMRWYYQETPHDVWDYDAASPPVLIDALDATGRRVPAVAEAGKTGWLYVIDRRTGKLIRVSDPFVPQPHLYELLSKGGTKVQPGDAGGAVGPVAYDPQTHVTFVTGNVDPEIGTTFGLPPRNPASEDQWKGGELAETSQNGSSLLSAIDVDTGHIRWVTPLANLIYTAPLSVRGLVFIAETKTKSLNVYDSASGALVSQIIPSDAIPPGVDLHDRALHFGSAALNGVKSLWHSFRSADTGYGSEYDTAPPIAYRLNGREYITTESEVFNQDMIPGGNTVYAFTLR